MLTKPSLTLKRHLKARPAQVFSAWTDPEKLICWIGPSETVAGSARAEMDVRVGGRYRLEFDYQGSTSAFFGTYQEVTPHSRLVWTNEESPDGSITTVTFEEKAGKTWLVMHELFPSKEALEAAGGAADAMDETFAQLDELLVTLGAGR